VIALKVELSHTDFTEVSRVIFVDISAVVMLATSHTATTGVLAVLPYTAVPGRDMAAAEIISRDQLGTKTLAHCFLVFVKRVGILMCCSQDVLRSKSR
jgi:hypothetical protein